MFRNRFPRGLALVTSTAALLSLGACADRYSPNSYNSEAVQQVARVDRGTVESVRTVSVKEANLALGGLAGGAAGGLAAASAGSGSGNGLAVLGGALAGAAIGAVIEHEATKTQAYEYIVQKANGDMLSVVQRDPAPLGVNQKVFVIYGVQARIIPDNGGAAPTMPPPPQN